MLNNIFFLLFTYLFSSIPFGLLISLVFFKKDIRLEGSKNIGATNMWRVFGKTAGIVTFLLDGIKGAIPVLLAKYLGFASGLIYLVAMIAILGHVFSIYLKFKGGKGVATTFLVLFALNFQIGLIATFIWVLFLFLFGFSSLSAIMMSILLIPFSIFYGITGQDYNLIYFNLAFTALILFKHRENIKKLAKGEEKKMFKKSLF